MKWLRCLVIAGACALLACQSTAAQTPQPPERWLVVEWTPLTQYRGLYTLRQRDTGTCVLLSTGGTVDGAAMLKLDPEDCW